MLELRVVAEKRSWIRHHIHIQATLVPRGPPLEGESVLDRVDNSTSMEGLDQKSPGNCLVGVVLQPPLHTVEGVVLGHQLEASGVAPASHRDILIMEAQAASKGFPVKVRGRSLPPV